MHLLTITFPVYERTTFFREALESAINQTVAVPIIVIDNGSSHNGFELICSEYRNKVKYYRNKTNIGMFANWNKCFELSESKYTMIVGDDDILAPTFVEEFCKIYHDNSDVDVFYTDVYQYNLRDNKFVIEDSNWNIVWERTTGRRIKETSFQNHLIFPSVSCVIKTDLQKKLKFETRFHTANDKLFIYTLPDDAVFYGLNKPLYYYRHHSDNDSAKNEKILILAHLLIFIYLKRYSKLSLKNLLLCYAYTILLLRSHDKIRKSFMENDSFYLETYNKMIRKRLIFICGFVISYFIEWKEKLYLFLKLKKSFYWIK